MLKTIKIDGKAVDFNITASFPLRFENQFNYDILQALLPTVAEIAEGVESAENKDEELISILNNLMSLKLTDIQKLIWTFAKAANKDIPEIVDWYDSFEEFPMIDIIVELAPCLIDSLISKKKLDKLIKQEKQ
jgi:hypothetical protein|nr:MAG TPA: tail assembly chaperone protein [Caudoviricetes sp.]